MLSKYCVMSSWYCVMLSLVRNPETTLHDGVLVLYDAVYAASCLNNRRDGPSRSWLPSPTLPYRPPDHGAEPRVGKVIRTIRLSIVIRVVRRVGFFLVYQGF
jgi:hypothetical protein